MEENKNNLEEQFLNDLDIDQKKDVLDEPLEVPENLEVTEEKTEETEKEIKNRHLRRVEMKLQKERETSIALAARLEGITEAQKLRQDTEEADFLKLVDPIYGNDSPEKIEATNVLKKALQGLHGDAIKKAKEEVLQEIEARSQNESQEVAENEQTLDEMLEGIEEDYNVNFESDENSRKGFLTLLERLSPKDKEGNIVEYADPVTTWETYQNLKEKSNSRAKQLASRSMSQSQGQSSSTVEVSAAERFLKENGII